MASFRLLILHYPSLFFIFLLLLSSSLSTAAAFEEQNRFHRPDPLRGFKLYSGGYDVRDKHYWASTAFTGVHGYTMAVVWLVGGLILLGSLPVWRSKNLISSSDSVPAPSRSRSWHRLIVLAILLFTIFSIVASAIVLVMAQRFHERAKDVERTLFGAGRATRHAVRRIVGSISKVRGLLCPRDFTICALLSSGSLELRKGSTSIYGVMKKIFSTVDVVLKISYGVNLGVVSLNLLLLISAIVFVMLCWRSGVIMIILICWTLISVFWFLSGFHFFLHIYSEDTCIALKDYQMNAMNSSLSSVLPCIDSISEDSIMVEVGLGIRSIISQLNANITNLLQDADLKEQNEVPNLLRICDPFSNSPNYTYNPTSCPRNSIPIHEIPKVLKGYKSILPQDSYSEISAYTSSLEEFIAELEDLKRLIQCSFLKEAFSYVLIHQCNPLQSSARSLWFSMVFLSISVMILVVTLIMKAFQVEERKLLYKWMTSS